MAHSTFLCPIAEFDIMYTVICGQTFRWRKDKTGWWSCLLPTTDPATGNMTHQLVRLWQDDEMVYYETGPRPHDLSLIHEYFRMDVDLPALMAKFSANDPHMREAAWEFQGLRVIRQDPVECLFSFLCTPAAPLYRIRQTIASLCNLLGDKYPGGEVGGLEHHAFPPIHRLADASIPFLTSTGLAYRARSVKESAQTVMANGGAAWLFGLRALPYHEAKAALMTLPGVGDKIADCVCLFSLDKDGAVPVDTHIRRIAELNYVKGAPSAKSLTKNGYANIGEQLRKQFGPMAGWAQQYLFFHDLYQKGAWETYTALFQPLQDPIVPLHPNAKGFRSKPIE